MPTPLPPFDLDLLRTFLAIVDNGGFTRAAERVGRTQSTVSLQIKKLEEGLGRRVFEREPGRDLQLTPEGEILLSFARQILRLSDEARSRLMEPDVAGTVRLGTPEDFATAHLPDVLARFARAHPRVALDVNCDFTVNLLDGFSKGQYDLVLFKREPQGRSGGNGVGVWREELVWAASPRLVLGPGEPLPLVLAPVPDVYRKRALASLDEVKRPWRIVYTSPSLAGLQAAVRAGLGMTVLPREMVPQGLVVLSGTEHGLPTLPDTEIVLYRAPGGLSRGAELLAEHIVHSLEAAAATPAPLPSTAA
ncbi:MAG TPA: LysR substrate-binding domain-containing protein [Microvirga sp.]|nr:LysR substrate-binding domain-containing protein [Microvirga sp.]